MKMQFLLFLFSCNLFFAQNQRFSYLYQFVADSTNQADVKSEMMLLDVLPKFSKFYSEVVFKSDSTAMAILEKEAAATGSINVRSDMRKGFVRIVIIKKSPDFKTFLITKIGRTNLKVADDRKMIWKILPEKSKAGEFITQKAETEIYGRKWTAWFTTEIPIQDGPYKFHGLPGLIVRIEDKTKSHSFFLTGIKNLSPEEVKNIDPDKNLVFDFGESVQMNNAGYKKFYLDSRNDPNRSIRAIIAENDRAQINMEGKMTDVSEYLRNREKQQKEKNAKDNNIIELDLLQ